MSKWIFYNIKIKKNRNGNTTSFHYPEWWDVKLIQPIAYEDTNNNGKVWEDCLIRIKSDAVEIIKKLDSYEKANLLTSEQAQQKGNNLKPEHIYIDNGKEIRYKFDIKKYEND